MGLREMSLQKMALRKMLLGITAYSYTKVRSEWLQCAICEKNLPLGHTRIARAATPRQSKKLMRGIKAIYSRFDSGR